MNNSLLQIWKDAETPVEYMIAAYIWFLFGIATVSWFSIVTLLVNQPERFKYLSFGIFDYL